MELLTRIGIAFLLTVCAALTLYLVGIARLRIPVLRVLRERGSVTNDDVIKALREMGLYPRFTPELLVLPACEQGVKAGLIAYSGHAIITRYRITKKGQELLEQHDWRRGKKKISV